MDDAPTYIIQVIIFKPRGDNKQLSDFITKTLPSRNPAVEIFVHD
jgi:hypothetical protein